MIEDAGLPLQPHPAQLPAFLVNQFARALKSVRWNNADVWRFAGCYLTEPKAQVVFQRPRRPLTLADFTKRVRGHGIGLALQSRMLFTGKYFFINGECHALGHTNRNALVRLADTRAAPAFTPGAATARLLYAWYCAGYIDV
jgi:50S ribosomal protein L16 3-hydroxylase